MTLPELKKLAESASKPRIVGPEPGFFEWEDARRKFLNTFNPQTALRLIEAVEVMREALNDYKTRISLHRAITPESVAFEQEFGVGRRARIALDAVDRLLEG